MKLFLASLIAILFIPVNFAFAQSLALHDGTPVRLRLSRDLSSADTRAGDAVTFEVLDDVRVDGILAIMHGALALGKVTEAQSKKTMSRGGKLNIAIEWVRLADDEEVALRATPEALRGARTSAMAGGIMAAAILPRPTTPFLLFSRGRDITIPRGTEMTAYVNGEIALEPGRFTKSK